MKQIAEEKGIPEVKVVETIEAAIAAAYKRDYGKKGQIIKAKLDMETGDISISQTKYVVEGADEEGYIIGELPDFIKAEEHEEMRRGERSDGREEIVVESEEEKLKLKFNPEKYLTLEEAKKTNKKLKIGDEVVMALEAKTDFGRIAAQTAKQVVIQRLREIEREVIFAEFKQREGDVVSGTVQRIEGRMVYIDLGKTNGLLVPAEQLSQDNYRIGQRLRLLLLRVEETNKGPAVLLSRTHPKLVLKLFEFEVPEIDSGTVEIKPSPGKPVRVQRLP